MARDMVTRYGMTDELGPMVYAENEGEVFLGRSVTKTTRHVRRDDAQGRCRDPPHHRRAVRHGAQADRGQPDKMHAMAKALLEWETIDAEIEIMTTSWPAG
jgi:cell division protease FtsH